MLHRLRRLGSLALLLALMGGGLGLPLFDAVVFHSRPLNAAANTIAPEGALAGHTQVCVLEHAGVVRLAIAAGGHADWPQVPRAGAVVSLAASLDADHDPTGLPPSRAPPIAG